MTLTRRAVIAGAVTGGATVLTAGGVLAIVRAAPDTGAGGIPVIGRVVPEAERPPAPVLTGEALTGAELDTGGWRGATVVNVWGSWCVPCRTEMPILRTIAAETRPLGVRFLGVNTRDNRAAAQAFTRRYRLPYASIFDPDGLALAAFGPLAPRAFPTTYLIDARRRIAAVYYGAVHYSDFRPAVVHVATEAS